jgi:uncharacterized protein YndB with AHSA1/START domain
MGRYRYTRRIDAAPEAVFRGFTEPELVADWMEASRVADPTGPLGVAGTRFTLVIRGPWRFATQVIRSEPGRLYETYATGPLGADYRMVATLTPLDGGGTDLDLLMEWTAPLGPIGRWVDRRWIEPEPHTAGNREVDRLVELVSA